MKKMTKRISAIALICIMLIGMAACGDRQAISGDAFAEQMQEKGYTLAENEEALQASDVVDAAWIATSEDGSYTIEFYEFTNGASAAQYFNNCRSFIESADGGASASKSSSVGNYSNYQLTSNGAFSAVASIDNTVFYVFGASKDCKEDILNVKEDLGY